MTTRPTGEFALLVFGASLMLGIGFDILFYMQSPGLNFPLYVGSILVLGWLISKRIGQKVEYQTWALIGLALFFSFMVFLRASELLTFFNVVAVGLLLTLVAYVHSGKSLVSYLPFDYLKIFALPIDFLAPLFKIGADLFSLRSVFRQHTLMRELVRGSLMAVLALFIFVWLLASADAVFNSVFSSIFSFHVDESIVEQFYLAAIVTVLFLGALGFALRGKSVVVPYTTASVPGILGAIETTILLGSITVLFFLFILLQVSYLFGGAAHIVDANLTYAQYATKGFWELVLVAVFSFGIISGVERFITRESETHRRSFKILSSILVVEVVAMLVSAFSRLHLYEQMYGFSTIRVYSYALMLWIAFMLVLLAYHIVRNTTRQNFTLASFCSVCFLLFFMNILNPDSFIAQRNIERYRASSKIDVQYLAELSSDAIPVTVQLLNDPNEATRVAFAIGVNYARNYQLGSSWQSQTISKNAALTVLAPYREYLLQATTTSTHTVSE